MAQNSILLNSLYYIVLHYIVLLYIILPYTVPYSTLHLTVQHTAQYRTQYRTLYIALHLHCICIALHCIALHCIALHCIALHCIALHCIALHCIALHGIALHCIALRCIALHCIATLHCSTLCSLVAWIGWPGGIFALPTKPASAACGGDATVVYQTIVPRATCPGAACSPPRGVQTTPSVASGARRPHADYETVMHTSRQVKHTHPASRS